MRRRFVRAEDVVLHVQGKVVLLLLRLLLQVRLLLLPLRFSSGGSRHGEVLDLMPDVDRERENIMRINVFDQPGVVVLREPRLQCVAKHIKPAESFLIDGLLGGFVTRPEASIVADAVLEEIAIAVQEGCDAQVMQSTPHIVLCDKRYYHSDLKPLLARWLLVWLSDKGIRGIDQDSLLTYVVSGVRGDPR